MAYPHPPFPSPPSTAAPPPQRVLASHLLLPLLQPRLPPAQRRICRIGRRRRLHRRRIVGSTSISITGSTSAGVHPPGCRPPITATAATSRRRLPNPAAAVATARTAVSRCTIPALLALVRPTATTTTVATATTATTAVTTTTIITTATATATANINTIGGGRAGAGVTAVAAPVRVAARACVAWRGTISGLGVGSWGARQERHDPVASRHGKRAVVVPVLHVHRGARGQQPRNHPVRATAARNM